jgi:P-type E1-E2 ATPase
LALASGLEQDVDHAVARAVIARAKKEGIAPLDVENRRVASKGVTALFKGDEVRLGARAFALPEWVQEQGAPALPDALSRVYLSVNGIERAFFEFGDTLRPGVADLTDALSGHGMDVHLISGDGPEATRAMAQLAGIRHFQGGLLPSQKVDYVKHLQADGNRVVMVGDGINDAPALATADLSVAVHRRAALAQQAAAVTLMGSTPVQLLGFFSLARRVNAKVSQNLGCAWAYNLLSIPVAMSGWLNPLVAATAMLLSSLTVIGNTMLLVRRR